MLPSVAYSMFVLQLAALRFQSETYRDAKPAPDGRSSTN